MTEYTYRVSIGGNAPHISKNEVVKETDKQITFLSLGREHRESKNSASVIHFKKYEEAKAFTIARCNERIERANKTIKECERTIGLFIK